MQKEEAKQALQDLREHLMDEMDAASTERDFARVEEVQSCFTSLSVLESRVVAGGVG